MDRGKWMKQRMDEVDDVVEVKEEDEVDEGEVSRNLEVRERKEELIV